MRRLRNFFKLPAPEKILLGESFLLVVSIGLTLRLVPFRVFKNAFAKRLAAQNGNAPIDWRQINSVVRSVRSVSRFVPFANCLTQALAAKLLINQSGQHTELKIGVAKDEKESFKAHAWLETNGRIIIGKLPSHRQYTALNSFFG